MATARIKRALRGAKLRLRKQMHAEAKVTAPEIKAADSIRDVYLSELAAGLSGTEIAKKYGVSRQSVHQLTTGYQRKRDQNRAQDARRRVPGRQYICGVCGEAGHNARRHEE